jgi:ribonuclease P protein component
VHAESGDPVAVEPGRSFTRARRLRRPRDFAAVLAAGRATSMRVAGEWLSVTAAWSDEMPCGTRLGITVSKRMARRAIDRALVKRIVREAFRLSAPGLEQQASAARVRVDISVRMKRPIGLPGDPRRPTLPTWRRALRTEVDQLLVSVAARLATVDVHA